MADPTPQETFAILMKELSASASSPLDASTPHLKQETRTLRQAIGVILWKCAAALTLSDYGGRPRSPKEADDLFGHVLSMRAEGLITQAILADLAARLGTDVKKIRDDAIASWS